MSRVWEIPVHDSTRVRDARIAAREACSEAGLAAARTAAAELVATELATNLLKHAGGGRMVVNLVTAPAGGGEALSVQLFSLDHGPGIADVGAARRDGWSTATGSLGAGLGSCQRSANAFHLYSLPAGGRWRRRGSTRSPSGAGHRRQRCRRAGSRSPSRRPSSAVTRGAGCARGAC